MMKFLSKFRRDEDGAVTVDWVVLTAAIVGLGIAVMSSVGGGTTALGDKLSTQLSSQTIVSYEPIRVTRRIGKGRPQGGAALPLFQVRISSQACCRTLATIPTNFGQSF